IECGVDASKATGVPVGWVTVSAATTTWSWSGRAKATVAASTPGTTGGPAARTVAVLESKLVPAVRTRATHAVVGTPAGAVIATVEGVSRASPKVPRSVSRVTEAISGVTHGSVVVRSARMRT